MSIEITIAIFVFILVIQTIPLLDYTGLPLSNETLDTMTCEQLREEEWTEEQIKLFCLENNMGYYTLEQ